MNRKAASRLLKSAENFQNCVPAEDSFLTT